MPTAITPARLARTSDQRRKVRMKSLTALVSAGILCLGSATALASPELIFKKGSRVPIALIGLEDVPGDGSGCSTHLGTFVVDSIAYDGVSEVVRGIHVTSLPGAPKTHNLVEPFLITINNGKLSEADQGWVRALVRKGSKLLIAYDTCGNGGYDSARDIYSSGNLNW